MDYKLEVKDVGELRDWMDSGMTELSVILATCGGDSKKHQGTEDQKAALRSIDGTEVTFDVTAILMHDDLIVAEVDLPEEAIIRGEKAEDPANFAGKFLKVETMPLLTKQTEPKGIATFLREEDADAWKVPLAQSVKEDPAGPEGCKLKANVQGEGRPGHIYLRWGAAFSTMKAREIVQILESRLQEVMD